VRSEEWDPVVIRKSDNRPRLEFTILLLPLAGYITKSMSRFLGGKLIHHQC
jgi:hypothetical protein